MRWNVTSVYGKIRISPLVLNQVSTAHLSEYFKGNRCLHYITLHCFTSFKLLLTILLWFIPSMSEICFQHTRLALSRILSIKYCMVYWIPHPFHFLQFSVIKTQLHQKGLIAIMCADDIFVVVDFPLKYEIMIKCDFL